MSDHGVNTSRRTFLIGATTGVAAIGVGAATVPFVQSWQPSARAKNAGAPVEVDVSQLSPGERVTVNWRGRPIWVLRRNQSMLETLAPVEEKLRDPESTEDQQPDYAQNQHRSIKPEYLVVIGICTHLGCSPSFVPDGSSNLEYSGFFCPCHNSKFDIAGRVYQGVPAPTNLVVPPHSYLSDDVVIIGSEEGETTA
jgi:ubiquinol-cytochrome c reductase iron-sulfur subunit